MKQIVAILLCAVLTLTFGVSVFAAGVDDGTLKVTTKDGQKFFGTTLDDFVKYVAANGDGSVWYDLNDDKDMNVCDLVALANRQVDFDQNDEFNSADSQALRLLLIGKN